MAETLSLLEFLQGLLTDSDLRGRFTADPQGTLHEYGLDDLSPADVHDALVLVEDNQTVDFSPDYASPPPTAPVDGGGHEAAVDYLNSYLTNNDAGDSAFGHDVFGQDPDIDASAIAVGDVAGQGAAVGDHHQVVTGEEHTVGFGTGSHLTIDDGAAFSSGDADDADHVFGHLGNDYGDHSPDDVGNDHPDGTAVSGDDTDDTGDPDDDNGPDHGNHPADGSGPVHF